MTWLGNAAIAATTLLLMEGAAYAVHRWVMHGPGWRWHRSHHQPGAGWFEKNDLFGLFFAALSLAVFVAAALWPLLWWVGAGMAAYGLLYALLHDGLVHRRIPYLPTPRRGYLKRLVQAHRLHHALRGRDGAVSYGFLYAPPVARLKGVLRQRQDAR